LEAADGAEKNILGGAAQTNRIQDNSRKTDLRVADQKKIMKKDVVENGKVNLIGATFGPDQPSFAATS